MPEVTLVGGDTGIGIGDIGAKMKGIGEMGPKNKGIGDMSKIQGYGIWVYKYIEN